MSTKSVTNRNDDAKRSPGNIGAKCGKCNQEGGNRTVCCVECKFCYHYECVQVTSEVLDGPWICNDCSKMSAESSNAILQMKLQEQRKKHQLEQQRQVLKHQELQQQYGEYGSEYLAASEQLIRNENVSKEPLAASTPVKSGSVPASSYFDGNQRMHTLEKVNRELREQLERTQRTLYEFPSNQSQQNILGTTKKIMTLPLSTITERTEKSTHGGSAISLSSKGTNRSAKLRELQMKGLMERQALEKKQLEEKLALERLLLEQDTEDDSDIESSTNIQKIDDWLRETDRTSSHPLPINETGLPGYSHPLELTPPRNRSATLPCPVPHVQPIDVLLNKGQLAARHTVKDLPRFGGDPEDWPRFIAAYERTTRMCGFKNDELLDRLERSLYDRALSSVKSLLLHPENVPVIISRLKTLFGNPEIIVETMVRRVRAMPQPKTDRMDTIIDFGVAVQNLCAAAQACQMDECLYNVALLQELVECLPPTIKVNWALHRQRKSTVSLADFSEWFGNLVEALSKVTRPLPIVKCQRNQRERKEEAYIHVHFDVAPGHFPKKCAACEKGCSSLEKCDKFRKMSPQSRWSVIKEMNVCRKCLKKHFKSCETKVLCGRDGCPYLHHQLLHDDSKHKLPIQASKLNSCNAHQCCLGAVLFKYVKITIYGKGGKSFDVYAFLDSGSTCSLMEHSLWEELELGGEKHPLCISWTGGQDRFESKSVKCSVDISGSQGEKRNRLNKVHTVENLQLPAQTMHIDDLSKHYKHLSGLPIDSYESIRPRTLLGMDNIHLDQPIEAREGGENQPVATLTRLGWIVYGPCSVDENSPGNKDKREFNYHICQCEAMHRDMKNYFSLDSLGIQTPSEPLMSKADERAMDLLRSHTVLEGKRYTTRLLWKFDNFQLPETKSMALNRFRCLEKRMSREPELSVALQAKIQDYERKGYIRKLTEDEERVRRDRVWYLPIFFVANANKPVTGDIREMFHQVGIHRDDQHCQRFLWNNGHPGSTPQVYVMQVMTFGASCSPSCAQFVKNTNAKRFAEEFPVAVNAIVHDHYVDDMLSSVETEREAIELAMNVREIHAQGGFVIRGWRSNSKNVQAALSEREVDEMNLNVISQFSTEKVLGMWWNSSTDTFTFKLPTKPGEDLLSGRCVPTKREVVRVLMSIFDPLGLLGNILMYLKILIQEVWRSGIGWDEVITSTQLEKWRTWLGVIEKVETVSVPRCYRLTTSCSTQTNVQLHIFVDASINGIAAVAYLRFEENDKIECAFVAAKTRVAPNKLTSIPRLELQAAVVGVRLARIVAESHRININKRLFWTDARDVLCWLHSDHRRFSPFVGFRVGEILENSELSEWRWVPSKLNPADDGTKWQRTPDLSQNSRWVRGQDFIWEKQTE
ncbi:uncharacterized protein LOC131688408 [Topomyia yanbarensis]|uniref:uncharacterized protein LOC131688408 n=1 Tax=Topomyia yanbarensis TaxID=2498891 RepID=UPI00273B8E57|nr:uncharacterized protein LOC131688408 [Topomyia yanbarensis]